VVYEKIVRTLGMHRRYRRRRLTLMQMRAHLRSLESRTVRMKKAIKKKVAKPTKKKRRVG
jgi:hypothetical protein